MNATGLDSSSTFNRTIPSNATATGVTTIGSLDIRGKLLGATRLAYSGAAPPNTVIYDTRNLTVTLNRQIVTELVTCGLTCTVTPQNIQTAAIDVEFHKAQMFGTEVSGDILIGETTAQ